MLGKAHARVISWCRERGLTCSKAKKTPYFHQFWRADESFELWQVMCIVLRFGNVWSGGNATDVRRMRHNRCYDLLLRNC